MNDLIEPAFSRNLGFLSEHEQAKLGQATVAIAGAGGDGGMLAIQLTRLGVGGLRLADPDPFEAENLNRQACCTTTTVGMNKAEVVAAYAQLINPDLKVDIYSDGITPNNTAEFVHGADLVIDETEFTLHALGVQLAREARREGVPNLMAMNIGFGATVTAFHPRGKTFESMLGLSSSAPIDAIAKQQPSISRWLPYIPPYGDLEVFKKVVTDEKSAPSVAPGVAVASGLAATQALLHLLAGQNNRPQPVYAPRVLMMDAMTGQSKLIKHPLAAHYSSLLKMAGRSLLQINPRASY